MSLVGGRSEAALLRLAWARSAIARQVSPRSRSNAAAAKRAAAAVSNWRSDQLGHTFGADDAVTVICVSNRPQRLDATVANVIAQRGPRVEFVFIANSDEFTDRQLDQARTAITGATVLRTEPTISLGASLNQGLAVVRTRFAAKFDDDDDYGANHLADSVIGLKETGATVVGKHTYLAHLSETDEMVLRFPGHEWSYTRHLAGGTLVFDTRRTKGISFPDRSIGEDRGFVRQCLLRGGHAFALDRFNYVQHRGAENTWAIDRDSFMRGCTMLGSSRAETTAMR